MHFQMQVDSVEFIKLRSPNSNLGKLPCWFGVSKKFRLEPTPFNACSCAFNCVPINFNDIPPIQPLGSARHPRANALSKWNINRKTLKGALQTEPKPQHDPLCFVSSNYTCRNYRRPLVTLPKKAGLLIEQSSFINHPVQLANESYIPSCASADPQLQ